MIKLSYPDFWQNKTSISYLLWPLSQIYRSLGFVRKILAKPIRFPAKVICVGNITVGGTGKTQVAIWLAKLYQARNINFVIITKAYGSNLNKATLVNRLHTPIEVGDESVILREYGTVIATKNIKQAADIIRQLKPEVIIVDDGMQNPNFIKDFTILVVDQTRMFGNEFLLPAGPLRQYVEEGLNAADAIISIGNKLNISTDKPTFNANIKATKIPDKEKNYFAFSGIGNPQRFLDTLQECGLKICGYRNFPDHNNYTAEDWRYLNEEAVKNHAELITTKKDYVKVKHYMDVLFLDVELIIDNQRMLVDLIYENTLRKV